MCKQYDVSGEERKLVLNSIYFGAHYDDLTAWLNKVRTTYQRMISHDEVLTTLKPVPAGKYVIPSEDLRYRISSSLNLVNSRVFVEVSDYPKNLLELKGSPGKYAHLDMSIADMYAVADVLVPNKMLYAKLYAEESGRCSICDSPLTSDSSLHRGMGPVCYGKLL